MDPDMKRYGFSDHDMPRVCVLLLIAALLAPAGTVVAQDDKLTLSALRKQREQLAQRKRRIIFNNDGRERSSFE